MTDNRAQILESEFIVATRISTPVVCIDDSRLFVDGQELKNYKITTVLGQGANGVVYRATNTKLQREEAVKVWHTTNERDRRNKLEQGLLEAQKLAQVSYEYAVAIYSAFELGGLLLATMEYVEGKTLEWYQQNAAPETRLGLAEVYLGAIVNTTTSATRHGDAHSKNVLVYEFSSRLESGLRLKLCDFGTSYYSGKESSEKRHWRIVKETILNLTHNMPHADKCRSTLATLWPKGEQMALEAYEHRKAGVDFSDHDIAQFWAAPLRDYILDLRDLNR